MPAMIAETPADAIHFHFAKESCNAALGRWHGLALRPDTRILIATGGASVLASLTIKWIPARENARPTKLIQHRALAGLYISCHFRFIFVP
jgi:hypothetical protein